MRGSIGPTSPPDGAPEPPPNGSPAFAAAPGVERATHRIIENGAGGCLLRERRIPLIARHGRYGLGAALRADPRRLALAADDEALADLDLRRAAFVDTETTGLAGGAGTYVFLVGVGRAVGEDLVVRQYCMRDHRDEAALLTAVVEELDRDVDGLVTFNGMMFDVPRLRGRLAACRLDAALPDRRHLDLCIVGRRLWRAKYPSGRLATLEAGEAGVRRLDDLPGAACPGAWFSFVRGEPSEIDRVFRHNLHDVLSLVVLAGRAAAAPIPDDVVPCREHAIAASRPRERSPASRPITRPLAEAVRELERRRRDARGPGAPGPRAFPRSGA